MNDFKITLLPDFLFEEDNQEKYQYGIIKIGNFQEKFLSSLTFWSSEDYMRHWIKSLKELNVNSKCGLIIDMYNPQKTDIIEWWILYKIDNYVYLQNSLLFLKYLKGIFNINQISKYVPERQTHTDEGELISEWCISMRTIESFISNHKLI